MQRSQKRACTALAESDSDDESTPSTPCQLFQTTSKALSPLYALKNTTQSTIISDFTFEQATEDHNVTTSIDPVCIQVLRSLLEEKAKHTLVLVGADEHMAMTTIPNGRFIVHDTLSDLWFAIRRSSQREAAILLDASLDSMSETWSFGERISEDHVLYQVKEYHQQPFKRMCSTPAKKAHQLDDTTEVFSQTSISDKERTTESIEDGSGDESIEQSGSESDVQQDDDQLDDVDDFDMLVSQLKLLQCVYCRELVSSKRNCEAKSFRCTKCAVIFKEDKINFWETEAGNPKK